MTENLPKWDGFSENIVGLSLQRIDGLPEKYEAPIDMAQNLSNEKFVVVYSSKVTDYVRDSYYPTVSGQLEKVFGNWKPGTPKQITKVAPAPTTAKLVLVDKPGAQQSQVRLGLAGPSRLTPDFTGLQVMNDLLGGAFSSRINLNLREEHGYTYGAFSTFTYLRDGGWFYVSSGVRTDVTAPSIREVAREMNRIVETNVTASELKMSKDGLAGALPARFETSDQTVGVLQNIYTFDLGLDYYSRYATQIPAITDKTVGDNAKKYLTPEKFVYVVVGDKAKIEEEIKKLNLGAIEYRDADGKVISK